MSTVVAFGIFDILHPGHVAYLEAAKKLGDRLVVLVGRDETALTQKGKRPAMHEKDRLRIVQALRCVDAAVLGDKLKNYQVLEKIRPDVLAVGYDQNAQHPVLDILKARGLHLKVVQIQRFGKQLHQSSALKSHIRSI